MIRPVSFTTSGAAPEPFAPAADRIVSGDPQQLAWTHYTDPTRQFCAGVWQGESGAWRVRYEPHEEEFCVLLEGSVTLTDDEGNAHAFHAGDAFVVPGGFNGLWENHGRVRKHFAIMTLNDAAR